MTFPAGRPGILSRINAVLHIVEDTCLVTLMLGMILMAASQILLRNVMGTSIVWGDVLVRILVLWVGMAGATAASRDGRHIRIDVASRYLPRFLRRWAEVLVALFTAVICGIAAFWSFQFVRMEWTDGTTAFARMPSWICQSVMPLGFGIISLRYVGLAWAHASGTAGPVVVLSSPSPEPLPGHTNDDMPDDLHDSKEDS